MYTEIQTEICVYVSLCVLDAELQRYMQACVRTQIRTDSHRYTWREETGFVFSAMLALGKACEASSPVTLSISTDSTR